MKIKGIQLSSVGMTDPIRGDWRVAVYAKGSISFTVDTEKDSFIFNEEDLIELIKSKEKK